MPPRDETRLLPPAADPLPTREVAVETPLLAAIRAKHGHGPLADMLYDAELKHRRELAERGQQLRARIQVLQEAHDRRRREGDAALAPLQQAMEDAQAACDAATAAYDVQRIKNQGDLMPLANALAEAYSALNRSGFADRFAQWTTPDWYTPMPEVPRLDLGPTRRPR